MEHMRHDFPGDFPPGHPVAGLQGGPVRRAVSPPRTDVKNDGHETNNYHIVVS